MNPAWNRHDAEKIAREHIATSGPNMGKPEFNVKTLDEIERPPLLYGRGTPEINLSRSWLVYVTDVDLVGVLMSSWLIVVSKTDGTVKYSGSAGDEG